jgi:cytochrome c oxidase subunit 1
MRLVSLDHKTIGLQYALTSLFFLFVGFALILLLRWQLAYPGQPIPLVGGALGDGNTVRGIMLPEFYTQLGAMHGTIMIFLAVVPLAAGAFGNYLIPLQVGARDMAFPRLNALSYWIYAAAGLLMLASFAAEGGAPSSGWTSYPPLAVIALGGQNLWLVAIILLGASSLLNSLNVIVTVLQLRAEGLTMMRLPFFVWAQLVTAFLLLLAFPPLQSAALLQLMDRVAGTSFFMPSGLVVTGQAIAAAGGGNPLLWQHLFWFLAHPEVYVLILPGLGIVAEVIAASTRKPLWGYRAMVFSALFMGFMSFLVWAHHMFLTGMGTTMSAFFQTTTMIVSVPSVIILTSLVVSLYGGSIRFPVPALFAIGFLPMFGLGGLTGLPLGLAATDIHLHDTYYVVGHFHYIVAPGTLFALFAGIYHWYPKVSGRTLSEGLGRLHFFGSFIAMNVVFFPMFIQGLAGLNRRLYDGGRSYDYAFSDGLHALNAWQFWGAVALGLFQLPFVINLILSLRKPRAAANPWGATTLEWLSASPPAHGNFDGVVVVDRGPYEYAAAGDSDFSAQGHVASRDAVDVAMTAARWKTQPRPDTGVTTGALGMWLFLASEVMLFGGLFSAYVLLRSGASSWPSGHALFGWTGALAGTLLLAAVSRCINRDRPYLFIAVAGGLIFCAVEAFEWAAALDAGITPQSSVFAGLYFTLTGLHGLHVLAGTIALLLTRVNRRLLLYYWWLVDLVWVGIVIAFHAP